MLVLWCSVGVAVDTVGQSALRQSAEEDLYEITGIHFIINNFILQYFVIFILIVKLLGKI